METKEMQKVESTEKVEKVQKKKVSTLSLFLIANVITMWGILALALVFYFPHVEFHHHGDATPYVEPTLEDKRADYENQVKGAEFELAAHLIFEEDDPKLQDEGVEILRKSLGEGSPKAASRLGTLYWGGMIEGFHTFDVAYALWAYALENGEEEPRFNFENGLKKLISPYQKENGELLLAQMKEFGVLEALDDYVSN